MAAEELSMEEIDRLVAEIAAFHAWTALAELHTKEMDATDGAFDLCDVPVECLPVNPRASLSIDQLVSPQAHPHLSRRHHPDVQAAHHDDGEKGDGVDDESEHDVAVHPVRASSSSNSQYQQLVSVCCCAPPPPAGFARSSRLADGANSCVSPASASSSSSSSSSSRTVRRPLRPHEQVRLLRQHVQQLETQVRMMSHKRKRRLEHSSDLGATSSCGTNKECDYSGDESECSSYSSTSSSSSSSASDSPCSSPWQTRRRRLCTGEQADEAVVRRKPRFMTTSWQRHASASGSPCFGGQHGAERENCWLRDRLQALKTAASGLKDFLFRDQVMETLNTTSRLLAEMNGLHGQQLTMTPVTFYDRHLVNEEDNGESWFAFDWIDPILAQSGTLFHNLDQAFAPYDSKHSKRNHSSQQGSRDETLVTERKPNGMEVMKCLYLPFRPDRIVEAVWDTFAIRKLVLKGSGVYFSRKLSENVLAGVIYVPSCGENLQIVGRMVLRKWPNVTTPWQRLRLVWKGVLEVKHLESGQTSHFGETGWRRFDDLTKDSGNTSASNARAVVSAFRTVVRVKAQEDEEFEAHTEGEEELSEDSSSFSERSDSASKPFKQTMQVAKAFASCHEKFEQVIENLLLTRHLGFTP